MWADQSEKTGFYVLKTMKKIIFSQKKCYFAYKCRSNYMFVITTSKIDPMYIFRLSIFLYYIVGILTANEEFHCVTENMFLYCPYDNQHSESLNLCNTCSNSHLSNQTPSLIWLTLQQLPVFYNYVHIIYKNILIDRDGQSDDIYYMLNNSQRAVEGKSTSRTR